MGLRDRPAVTGTRWNATEAERLAPPAADDLVENPVARWVRAIDIDASPPDVWRWLCQLRVAPYSYDLLDNLGRRSPQTLTPGLEQLELGQRFMTMFRLADFERDRHVTLISGSPQGRLPRMAVSYVTHARPAGRSRLVAHVLMTAPRGIPRRLGELALAALGVGDAVMMRRQLLNLARLSERDARSARARP